MARRVMRFYEPRVSLSAGNKRSLCSFPGQACNDLFLAKSVVVTTLQQPSLGLARSFGERQAEAILSPVCNIPRSRKVSIR